MKVQQGLPPNIDAIDAVFGVKNNPYVVYTYGDTLYGLAVTPTNVDMHLWVHESIHERQQGSNPESWWNRYLNDKQFRLDQEVEAYTAQLLSYNRHQKDRNQQAVFLLKIATDLASEIYGSLVSQREAVVLLNRAVKKYRMTPSSFINFGTSGSIVTVSVSVLPS